MSYGDSSPVSKPQDEPSGIIPDELEVGTVQEDPVKLRRAISLSFTEVVSATPVRFCEA
jgi:hypothetical protein